MRRRLSRNTRNLPPLFIAFMAALVGVWLSDWLSWLPIPPPPPVLSPIATIAFSFMGVFIVIHVFRRLARRRLLVQNQTLEDLRRLDWASFERLVGEAYRQKGWVVTETGQGGADGGIDLKMTRHGQSCLVQVKQWRGRVGAPIIREQFGLLHHHGVDSVAIVAMSGFTREAVTFAKGKPLVLVDGPELVAMITGLEVPPVNQPSPRRATPPKEKPPLCPKCAAVMVRRQRKSDKKGFWGCSRYPSCFGMRS